jgi:hypothetical protein
MRMGRLSGKEIRRVFGQRSAYALGVMVLCVMVFQAMLAKVGAPRQIGQELQDVRIPLVVVVAALPFISGVVTGLAVGFVGTSFPIVLELLNVSCGGQSILPYIPLAYAFGHLGQMASPIHICQVVSNQYFKTDYGPVYRRLIPSALLTAAMAVGYFLLLRWVL